MTNAKSIKAQPKSKTAAKPEAQAGAPPGFTPKKKCAASLNGWKNRTRNQRGELDHVNTYTLLVAVVLSAQATDVGVNKATKDLFKVADTPEKMVALGEEKVRDYIKTIGLYKAKAKNVIALSERLIAEYGSEVAPDREILENAPGRGA